MAVNYNDNRFLQVEDEKNQKLEETNKTYQDLINERNDLTNQQSDLVNKWQQTQNENLDKQLQFQQDLINQQKQEAEKSYQDEAKSAYTDYRKETDNYGVSREQQLASGLGGAGGYSESSRVSMYNTYQNRLSTARKSMDKAYLEFDNAIREAQLTNDVTKAENALQALQQKLQISLEGFNYKSEQTQNKLAMQQQINNEYYNRYQDVLNQINYENEQAEARRRWEAEYALSQQQLAISRAQKAAENARYEALKEGNDNKEITQTKNNQKYESAYTPNFNNNSGARGDKRVWFSQTFGSGVFTLDEINKKLAQGLSSGAISDEDVNKIYKAYGVSY